MQVPSFEKILGGGVISCWRFAFLVCLPNEQDLGKNPFLSAVKGKSFLPLSKYSRPLMNHHQVICYPEFGKALCWGFFFSGFFAWFCSMITEDTRLAGFEGIL